MNAFLLLNRRVNLAIFLAGAVRRTVCRVIWTRRFGFFLFSQCAVSVAALRFLPSRMACNSKDRVGMGDLHRHHRVMRAGWNNF